MRTLLFTLFLGLTACSESKEAATVPVDVHVDGAGLIEVTTNLGYTVRVTTARAVIEGFTFTRSAMVAQRSPLSWLIGTAHAHPGHDGAGEVVGDLSGRFVLDWTASSGEALGTAVVLETGFDGARFLLTNGTDADGLAADDPLNGHAVELAGVATKDGTDYPFSVTARLDEAAAIEGVPVVASTRSLPSQGIQLAIEDPFESDTLFDGIDFATADLSEGGADHNRLMRALRSHDHYLITGDNK